VQIAAGADDVNEEPDDFVADDEEIWVGNGESLDHSYTGLRFTNVTIPQRATITSAYLQVYLTEAQWINVDLTLAAEAADNSAPFSETNLPSQRALTTQQEEHHSNEPWPADTWRTLDEIGAVIEEVVNRPGWQSGNSLAVILKGIGDEWGRKYVTSADEDPELAPRLVITYTT
jgi:hypothetical protein